VISKPGEAGALYAFMGWLTSRKEVVGPFSRTHDAAHAAELVDTFCKSQEWEPKEKWYDLLKSYPKEPK